MVIYNYVIFEKNKTKQNKNKKTKNKKTKTKKSETIRHIFCSWPIYIVSSGVPWVSGARGKKLIQRPFFYFFFFTKNSKMEMVDPKLISVIFKSEKQKKKKVLSLFSYI